MRLLTAVLALSLPAFAVPSAKDMAMLSCRAYANGCARFMGHPAGWTVVSTSPRSSGLEALAARNENGELAVVYAGTDAKDPLDIAADKALVKIATLPGRSGVYRKAEAEARGGGWKANPKSTHYTYQVLAVKLWKAEQFLGEARKAAGSPKVVMLGGHSLGGLIAKVTAARQRLPAHVFNPAPAGRWLAKNPKATVVVHRRASDAVSTLATHFGQICQYPDKSADPKQIHGILAFAKDLLGGLKPDRCKD